MFPVRFALFGVVMASMLPGTPLYAATVADDLEAALPQGRPMAQRFLTTGASVVTTSGGMHCVTSSRIEIATSRYMASDGSLVPFANVVRSVASSVQAIAGAGPAAPDFRVQLKYSLKPGSEAWLDLGAEGRIEVSGLVEASTDSLLFTGDLAIRLAATFRSGQPITLVGVSIDTDRVVTDQLVSPELTILEACQATLPVETEVLPPMAALVTLDFLASPTEDTRATVEEMRACAMTPTDRPVHLGSIRGTTGFFSQTDKVFVAFDDAGRPERVYVPGILDAGLDHLGRGEARISRAADSNVPDAENEVKGCLGAMPQEICVRPIPGDADAWQLRPCWLVPGLNMATRGPFDPALLMFPQPPEQPSIDITSGRLPERRSGTTPSVTGTVPPILERLPLTPSVTVPRLTWTSGRAPIQPETTPPSSTPSPVPLPGAGWAMVSALIGIALLRRRRHRG